MLFPQPGEHAQHVVTPLSATPSGARLVESEASRLVVGATSLDELPLLLAHPAFARRPGAYALFGDKGIRWGETLDVTGRLEDHLTDPPLAAERVILITSPHPAFGRDAVAALQNALHHQSLRAGRVPVVGAPPQRGWLQVSQPALVARWLADLRPLLVTAGCSLLEPPGSTLKPRVRVESAPEVRGEAVCQEEVAGHEEAANENDADVPFLRAGFTTEIPHQVYEDAEARRYQLAYRGVQAEAVAVEGFCVVLAGSGMAVEDGAGVQICIARKRARLIEEGIARPRPGADVVRLSRDLGLPSLTNAGRLLSGTNRTARELWVRVA
ncbi:MAG TPA: hypothetical protein VGU45_16570 [Microvirga sp.]|jgi:hypothetical protein|nr:hypothetical protein [Microvirga sp.]